jgi:hypothetical protein
MKLGEVRAPGFKEALQSLSEQKLPMMLGYKVSVVKQKIESALLEFEKSRKIRAEDLAEKDEEGKAKIEGEGILSHFVLSPESLAQLNKEIAELEQVEVEVPKLSFNLFPPTVSMSANEIGALAPIIGE